MKLIDDLSLFADYILSLGTHKKDRPLEPIEVADLTQRLIDEFPFENLDQISKRTPVKADQLKEFLKLRKLPKQVQYTLGWGGDNKDKLAFSSGAIISELEDPKEMEILCKIAIENKLKKHETERIIALKKKDSHMPLVECVEAVLKLRPIVEEGYIFIIPVSTDTLHKLNELSARNQTSVDRLVTDLIGKTVQNGKVGIAKIKKTNLYLTVGEETYKSIVRIQNDNKIRLKDLGEFLIWEGIKHE